jgi:hypothetical protein
LNGSVNAPHKILDKNKAKSFTAGRGDIENAAQMFWSGNEKMAAKLGKRVSPEDLEDLGRSESSPLKRTNNAPLPPDFLSSQSSSPFTTLNPQQTSVRGIRILEKEQQSFRAFSSNMESRAETRSKPPLCSLHSRMPALKI